MENVTKIQMCPIHGRTFFTYETVICGKLVTVRRFTEGPSFVGATVAWTKLKKEAIENGTYIPF